MAYEIVGWLGAASVLVAYVLVARRGTSVTYHLLNIAGGVGLLANALHHRALPSTAVNVLWIGIALWALGVTTRQRPKTPAS